MGGLATFPLGVAELERGACACKVHRQRPKDHRR